MKFFLSITLLLIVSFTIAQTLEFSTPLVPRLYGSSFLYSVSLTVGDKIVKVTGSTRFPSSGPGVYTDSLITIYNSDYSIYDNFTIPLLDTSLGCRINHLSDNLFNSDSKVEAGFMCGQIYAVYADDGSKIFTRDSVSSADENNPTSLITIDGTASRDDYGGNYFKTSSGWKLYLEAGKNHEIYSLPGTQPVTALAKPVKDVPFNFSNPYPNPTDGMARIDFTLPPNTKQGEVLVYTEQGQLIKTFMVDNTFGTLLINNSNLPAGTYYYVMKVGDNFSDTKKQVVIP